MRIMWQFRPCLLYQPLQQHLVRTKKRTEVAMILESRRTKRSTSFCNACWDMVHAAINPYLAHESIKQLIDTDMLHKDYYAAVDDYNECCYPRNRQDRIQDGNFHDPVLSGIQDL